MQKPPVKKELFIVRVIGGVFVGVPFGIAKSILILLSGLNKTWLERLILAALACFSLFCILKLGSLFDLLDLLFQSKAVNPGWESGVKFSFFFLIYLAITMPVFLCFAYLNQEARFFKQDGVKRDPPPERMRTFRLKSDYHKVYLGYGLNRDKPLYLTNDQRLMHCEVVGSTGTGKTESVLLPMLAHDIAHGKGAIIIDGKGDLELRNKIRYIVRKQKREDDFYFFSLSHPEKSNTYNPLYRGNPTELKDKLVNSMAWSDEFYRRMAEQAALTLLNAIASTGRTTRFRELHGYLTDLNALKKLSDETTNPVLKEDIGKMVNSFKDNQKFLAGLMSDLFLTSRSEFSDLLDTDDPQIDLLSLYENNQICYFALDLQKYADTSRRIGRMIIQDVRAVSSHIVSHVTAYNRHFFPVFIDDASSFLELNFIDFLNKCRASGYAVTMLHQSLGDLVYRGMPNFQQQVIENTNIKIILRQDDPFSVEKFVKIAGTRRTMISTYQTEEQILGKGLTGAGSVREGQTFRIEPDLIRGLKRGEAALIWKNPSLLTEHVKLDFFGYSSYSDDFAPKKSGKKTSNAVEKKEEKDEAAEKDQVLDEIDNPLEIINDLDDKK
ncbi:MAG: TraM recognition domain-containing protein [Candidatus Harrisonbacteria bacterium]|nr:TraM recognition domain-containing protein [Candidatus Harrisonbacteria bacterium]